MPEDTSNTPSPEFVEPDGMPPDFTADYSPSYPPDFPPHAAYGGPYPGYDDGCCDPGCCDPCGPSCGSGVGFAPRARWLAGFEFTFVQPRFEDNTAFTRMESDGNSFESFSDTQFDYDLELTPRVWLGYQPCGGTGGRITYWQFDHGAATVSASPPANGFGQITHPPFGDVDLSTTIPTDTFAATTDLNAYTIDVEALSQADWCAWQLAVAYGVRYASLDQSYRAQLRDDENTLLGQIDFQRELRGVGPTVALSASRCVGGGFSLFGSARGSVLFGDGEDRLNAGEDLDLSTPFTTTRTTRRDDLWSIAELQTGIRWLGHDGPGSVWQPFVSAALEGGLWNGAGNATTSNGDLGFVGFNVGVGLGY